MPAIRNEQRASSARYRADDQRDDWEAAEEWQAFHEWDEMEQAPTHRSLVPALAAYQQPAAWTGKRAATGSRTSTRANRAGNRLWALRYVFVVAALLIALTTTFAATGQWADVFAAFRASAGSQRADVVVQKVQPITSLLHPEQFDSTSQFNSYGGASCSPTVLAEVLTAWGVQNATIGRMIDDLGSYLSPSAGLLDQQGFQAVAAKHDMRADISWHMTYNQMLYLTNVLGIPVIVNFRSCTGYYHWLCGGHFLVVTSGDQNGVNTVDSSELFIKHLDRSTFDSLWYWRGDGTAMTVVVVPTSYHYTLPKA
jgi:hypothetical protein